MLVQPPSGKEVRWQEMLRHELLDALDQQPVVILPVGSVEHGVMGDPLVASREKGERIFDVLREFGSHCL